MTAADAIVDLLPLVLLHADWRARGSAVCVCRRWRDALLTGEAHWQWLCGRLRDEALLYVPDGSCVHAAGWRAAFLELWQRRTIWAAQERSAAGPSDEEQAAPENETFSISVAVRFRPKDVRPTGDDVATSSTVTVPLHQRVAMVRAAKGCTHKEAMRTVMGEDRLRRTRPRGGGGGGSDAVEIDIAVGARPPQEELDAIARNQELAAAATAAAVAADAPRAASAARRKPYLTGGRIKQSTATVDGGGGGPRADGAPRPLRVTLAVESGAAGSGDASGGRAAPRVSLRLRVDETVLWWARALDNSLTAAATEPERPWAVGTREPTPPIADGAATAWAEAQATEASRRGHAALKRGNATEARRLFSKAYELEPSHARHLLRAADALLAIALGRESRGRTRYRADVLREARGEYIELAADEGGDDLRREAGEKLARVEAKLRAAEATVERLNQREAAEREAKEAGARGDALESEAVSRALKETASVPQRPARRDEPSEADGPRQPVPSLAEGLPAADAEDGTAEDAAADAARAREPARADESPSSVLDETRASILSMTPATGEVLTMAPGCGLRPFRFERVLPPDAAQEEVYSRCARASVAQLLNGLTSCVLVYGAGKTYTMFGEGHEGGDERLPHRRGIVPRVCGEVVAAMDARRASGIDAELSVAYVEVFGAQVTDLLRGGAPIGSAGNAPDADGAEGAADGGAQAATNPLADNSFHAHRWVLEGRCDVPLCSLDEALRLLAAGEECKRRSATKMNERSSRAHALFILRLTQERHGTRRSSRLILADLGGSEKLSRTDVAADFRAPVIMVGDEEVSRISWVEYYQRRTKLQESLNINVGLYALQRCIEALIHRDAAARAGVSIHVPFADSKLTLMLKDALSGGARTTVLLCASMEPANAVESIATLRFGEACSRVETRAAASGDGAGVLTRLVAELDEQIRATEAAIARDQRWEKVKTVRYDEVRMMDNFVSTATHEDVADHEAGVMVVGADDGTGRVERVAHEVVANVLVGAEEDEARLAELLQRRRKLTGAK